jgi:hypothetical protein
VRHLRRFLYWNAHLSPWGRLFTWLAHVSVYGETPATTLRDELALADRMEAAGHHKSAAKLREVRQDGAGVGPKMRRHLSRTL